MVWCNYLTTKLLTMKKLSVFVSLSLMLSSLSWAEKYEFVRLVDENQTLVLQNGDIAWVVNGGATFHQSNQLDRFNVDNLHSVEFASSPEVNSFREHHYENATFVGPCYIWMEEAAIADFVTFKILRSAESGNKTLEWDGEKFAGGIIQDTDNNDNSSPVPDPNGIKYDQLLGWCYFPDTPWIYSYTNGSWYYMHSMQDGIYVWNANLPSNGWMKLHG